MLVYVTFLRLWTEGCLVKKVVLDVYAAVYICIILMLEALCHSRLPLFSLWQ